ncbi:uracil phosphoribosyltransferase [Rubellicoccus peritrichatus]|uniref:Uracil phosphoribosyltransferase n=1 Tax=Rubellicoccus peritrichatus TaxID=3080537 RepID=A0AAQ3L7P6_9BACT|nr:uracil phosphoribosyltransferase [Puniceicoccus sp. CR14]WOO40775.1 uracil phosphoribosyltransferase [Puniceicoccus sp. CR14]
MALHIVEHPAARHYLTILRDEQTPHATFRAACEKLTLFLAMEATRSLKEKTTTVVTPLEETGGFAIEESPVVVPILRAGLGMLQVFVDLLPEVSVGYVGMERDETTAKAKSYYCKLPPMDGRTAIAIDPMLATGGSAEAVVQRLYDAGAATVKLVNIVAAPEGLARIEAAFPEIEIIAAALDRCLNEKAYICPGLGDFGDRLYGT